MMAQAFYTGISGIRTGQVAIDATADNLANISTIGYRGYGVEFSSLFENMMNTSGKSSSVDSTIGVGASVQTSTMRENSGALAISDKSTDLAIYGDGWFGIQGEHEPLYTRAGNFTFDQNNDLVTPDGMYVLGTMGKNIVGEELTGKITEVPLAEANAQEKLRFPKSLYFPAVPTSNASFFANLGVAPEPRTISAAVIDGEGTKNELKLLFTQKPIQTPPGIQWDVVATTQTLGGATVYDTQTGEVEFSASGALLSSSLTSIDNNGTSVSMDLGSQFSGIVALNTPVVSGSSSADGTIGGDLLGYEINRNAEVIATFSNGEQSSVGKIALYHFQNDQGLTRVTGANFSESANSGKPIFFQDANGNNILGADVINFKLENSNVRMEVSLTELIVQQRSFDSNSKVITAVDQMIQKALSM